MAHLEILAYSAIGVPWPSKVFQRQENRLTSDDLMNLTKLQLLQKNAMSTTKKWSNSKA